MKTATITVVYDKTTPKKIRLTGISEDDQISVGVYLSREIPIHSLPEEITLKLDFASLGRKGGAK